MGEIGLLAVRGFGRRWPIARGTAVQGLAPTNRMNRQNPPAAAEGSAIAA
jgi:hypothetical protein